MKCLLIYFLFLQVMVGLAQSDEKQSLIVVHVEPGSGAKFRQLIVSYHFLNGNFIGRDELLTVAGKMDGKDYIRTDIGNSVIYKDRYLITGIGNIIDLDEKKVLFDGRAALIRCNNDSAVFFTDDIFKGKFYSVYDFRSGQYGEVKDLLFKAKTGQDVEFDKSGSPFKLYYYPAGKPKVLLSDDAGFGQPVTTGNYPPDPPTFWIGQNEFVYGRINKENTELSVYKLSVSSNQKKLLGKISISPEKKPGSFLKLDDKNLLLSLGSRQIFVDLKAETISELDYTRPDCGFSFECKDNAPGRIIRLNGKEVGTFHFRSVTFKADKNIAAFVKEISVGDESYQQGLAVWNNNSKTWQNVDAEEVLCLVGWVNH